MSSPEMFTDEELEDNNVGSLKPAEVIAVQRVYDSHDCPKNIAYMARFHAKFDGKLGAEEWFINDSNKHLLLQFPARICQSSRDSKLTLYGNKDSNISKVCHTVHICYDPYRNVTTV
jgi:hypothetical protein